MMSKGIEVVGQLVGFKKLKVAGGWRLEIDLFDSRPKDIVEVACLVNVQETVMMRLEAYEEETKGKEKKKASKKEYRTK